MARDLKEFYDERFADGRGSDVVNRNNGFHLISMIPASIIPNIHTIAEIGGGYGGNLFYMNARNNFDLYNYELSEKAIEIGRERYPNIKHISCDFTTDDTHHHDLIVLCDVVEHFEDDKAFLTKVATHGKYFVMKIPLEKALYNKLRAPKPGKDHPSGHYHIYNKVDALKLLKGCNFKVISVKQYHLLQDPLVAEENLFNETGKSMTKGFKIRKGFFKILPFKVYTAIFGSELFVFCES